MKRLLPVMILEINLYALDDWTRALWGYFCRLLRCHWDNACRRMSGSACNTASGIRRIRVQDSRFLAPQSKRSLSSRDNVSDKITIKRGKNSKSSLSTHCFQSWVIFILQKIYEEKYLSRFSSVCKVRKG